MAPSASNTGRRPGGKGDAGKTRDTILIPGDFMDETIRLEMEKMESTTGKNLR